MAIGTILSQASISGAPGTILVNKTGAGDPNALSKGNYVTFTFQQGGGSSQLPAGKWIKVPVDGSARNGYYATANLIAHDCITKKKKKATGKVQPDPTSKGVIIIKNNPDAVLVHPDSGGGALPATANTAAKGDFVKFDISSSTPHTAQNVKVHNCTHSA